MQVRSTVRRTILAQLRRVQRCEPLAARLDGGVVHLLPLRGAVGAVGEGGSELESDERETPFKRRAAERRGAQGWARGHGEADAPGRRGQERGVQRSARSLSCVSARGTHLLAPPPGVSSPAPSSSSSSSSESSESSSESFARRVRTGGTNVRDGATEPGREGPPEVPPATRGAKGAEGPSDSLPLLLVASLSELLPIARRTGGSHRGLPHQARAEQTRRANVSEEIWR